MRRGLAGRALARLVRFYGLSPRALLALPAWQVELLAHHLPALEAEEMQARIIEVMMPLAEPGERRRLLARLERRARLPRAEVQAPVEVHDPEAAREWFEARGIVVVHRRKGDGDMDSG